MKNYYFFVFLCSFFLNTFKYQWFCQFRWLHRKNHIKIYQKKKRFYARKNFEVDKKMIISSKKMINSGLVQEHWCFKWKKKVENTCSSKRIFNPMRYTGMHFVLVVSMNIDVVISKNSPEKFAPTWKSSINVRISPKGTKLIFRCIEKVALKICLLSSHLSFNETCMNMYIYILNMIANIPIDGFHSN